MTFMKKILFLITLLFLSIFTVNDRVYSYHNHKTILATNNDTYIFNEYINIKNELNCIDLKKEYEEIKDKKITETHKINKYAPVKRIKPKYKTKPNYNPSIKNSKSNFGILNFTSDVVDCLLKVTEASISIVLEEINK